MRIIIAGGGTGGHLFPGIAVAEEFVKRYPETSPLFVGTEHGIEARIIPREGYRIKFIKAEGLVGKSFLKKIKSLFSLLLSLPQSFRIISEENPDIVIGVGGYASFGMVMAASLKGVKTMILEQNSTPGFANRILGRFANAVAVTYPDSFSFFNREKTYLTGNPVRKSMFSKVSVESESTYSDKKYFNVLIFGGSQGSHAINKAVVGMLNYLLDLRQHIRFIHQTGEADLNFVESAYQRLGFIYLVEPFIYRMAEAYAAADVVICRAGATTLAEITVAGKAAVLIPYPHAASNHQELNAKKLEEMGAAIVITEKQLSGENLARAIRDLYANPDKRAQMQRSSRAVGRSGAAEKIVDIAESLLKK